MKGVPPLLRTFSDALSAFSVGPTDKIVVAVSGGADSICLLHLFRQWRSLLVRDPLEETRPPGNFLHVAHLNHALRPHAEDDAIFVSSLCQAWEIPCAVSKRSVRTFCQERRLSLQEGARQVRYAFLREVANACGARWIAVGHTADDQVETILLHLLRGAGGGGLRGMPPLRDGIIIRPLLSLSRKEILEELRKAQIPFREDPSNQDRRYLRNRVRQELIPLLQTYNPNIRRTLLRVASLLSEENDFLNRQADDLLLQGKSSCTTHEVALDLSFFCALHKAMQRRLLRRGIGHLSLHLSGVGLDAIDRIVTGLLKGPAHRSQSLPLGLTAKKTRTALILQSASPLPQQDHAEYLLPKAFLQDLAWKDATVAFPFFRIQITFALRKVSPAAAAPKGALFDMDLLSTPLAVRSVRPGDRFAPLGMQGHHKKLQDFFTDSKIPKETRHLMPLLVSPEGIVWVIGYRMDERYRVTEKTKRTLSLTYCPLDTARSWVTP